MSTLSPRREMWLLLTLAGIQFTNIVDFMIMMPLGPQFRALFGIDDAQFGLLVSAYTFAAAVSGLLATTYIDRFDRKRLLLILYVLFALATLACGLAQSFSQLMLARVAAGAFGGVLSSMAQTVVGELIPFERRGKAMGIVMSSFSVATVAGVPISLFLAAHLSWHAPFFTIAAVSALFAIFAFLTLPNMQPYGAKEAKRSVLGSLKVVLSESGHRTAMLFSVMIVFVGFTTIPYITLYMQGNVGLTPQQIPYIYLVGGLATLLTSRWIGVLADKWGKPRVFSILAVATIAPLFLLTTLGKAPLWVVLIITTLFFILLSGRMIPGMALLTAAAKPEVRGSFMTINSAMQSAGMGIASWLGGQIITRDASQYMQGYWKTAVLGTCASLASVYLVRRLKLYDNKAN